jgi:hypothetical protein
MFSIKINTLQKNRTLTTYFFLEVELHKNIGFLHIRKVKKFFTSMFQLIHVKNIFLLLFFEQWFTGECFTCDPVLNHDGFQSELFLENLK